MGRVGKKLLSVWGSDLFSSIGFTRAAFLTAVLGSFKTGKAERHTGRAVIYQYAAGPTAKIWGRRR